MADNFYSVLGVSEKATKDEIKKAYRGLQMKHHPDKNPGSQESVEMTQKINEAYETLGDEQKKGSYDNTRLNPNPFMRMASQGGGSAMEVPIDDIFNMFFGNGANPFGMGEIHLVYRLECNLECHQVHESIYLMARQWAFSKQSRSQLLY